MHIERWHDCHLCPLHKGRTQVVITRGTIPCDLLFIGEAPGESEDANGIAFYGPAGKLLDRIIDRALCDFALRCAFANLVGCIPREEGVYGKLEEPPDESIKKCSPRLREFIGICNPRMLILVGKLAGKWVERSLPVVEIQHPSAILRANIAQKGLLIQKAEVTLHSAVEDFLEEGETNDGLRNGSMLRMS
jgi:DNA polymerase